MVLMNHRDLDVTRVNFDCECQSRNLLFMVVVHSIVVKGGGANHDHLANSLR